MTVNRDLLFDMTAVASQVAVSIVSGKKLFATHRGCVRIASKYDVACKLEGVLFVLGLHRRLPE